MGVLFTIAIISGVVLYRPFMTKLPFGMVRRDRSRRLKWLDLHNLLGIGTAGWLLVVGLTGVINTLDEPLYASRSEEHTSELQSLMRISYAVFCLKKKKTNKPTYRIITHCTTTDMYISTHR